MISEHRFALDRPDDARLAAYRWSAGGAPRAVIVLAHGMGEHARRYPPALAALIESGIDLYALDHRGHGVTMALMHGLPGDFGPGGFPAVVEDLAALARRARSEHPRLPLILVGHSMGSFIAQAFVLDHANLIDALVLVGTTAVDRLAEDASRETDVMAAFNRAFEPVRTPADWLSTDTAEVDAYVADPLCGFALVPESMGSMFAQAARLADPAALAAIPKALPLYILVGALDPLGVSIGRLAPLLERYRAAGLAPVVASYPHGRHEILNEVNRAEVVAGLKHWLEGTIAALQS